MKVELPQSLVVAEFPEFPSECVSVSFYLNELSVSISEHDLTLNPSKSLSSIGKVLQLPIIENEFILQINHRDSLKIEVSGDYVMFARDDQELLFWNQEEFKEAASEVLGAVAGHLVFIISNPINDEKVLPDDLPIGFQIINSNYDTYNHELYEVFGNREEAESVLINAQADYPDERWVIEPVYANELK